MLILRSGDYTIEVSNSDPPFRRGSADNVKAYDCVYCFGDSSLFTSQHTIRLQKFGQPIKSCLLSSDGGASGIHARSAIVSRNRCIIAVGPYIAALDVPSLELLWATQVDDATCFGVYNSDRHDCLLFHGELSIARVDHSGEVIWRAGGADIFTNGFELDGDVVRATDFYNRLYVFDIETGAETTAGR